MVFPVREVRPTGGLAFMALNAIARTFSSRTLRTLGAAFEGEAWSVSDIWMVDGD